MDVSGNEADGKLGFGADSRNGLELQLVIFGD